MPPKNQAAERAAPTKKSSVKAMSVIGIPTVNAKEAENIRTARRKGMQQLATPENAPPPLTAPTPVPAPSPVPTPTVATTPTVAGVPKATPPKSKAARDESAKERKVKDKERREKAATPGPGILKRPLVLRVSSKEKILFTRHLSVMLEAGIPLQEVLSIYIEQAKSPGLKYILRTALAELSNGETLAAILGKFPRQFEPFFVHIVKVGEETGTLPASLRYIETQIRKSHELKSKVRAALLYPAIVFFGAIGIACYLAFYLLPKLVPIFVSLGVKLPASTVAMLAISNWLQKNWHWFSVLVVVSLFGLSFIIRLYPVRYALHRLFLLIPVLGQLVREIQITQFSRILGTLHASGVHIIDALTITSQSLTNLVFQYRLSEITKLVERGETLGDELLKYPKLFSRTCSSMVMIGERTGKLSESLITLSEFSESEVDNYTKNLSSLIEPLTLLFLGAIVGFVAFSIISPIYQLTGGLTR